MSKCIGVMENLFKSYGSGKSKIIERSIIPLSGRKSKMALMPASLADAEGAKVITIFEMNRNTPFQTIQGAVLLFEARNGSLLGIFDSASITALRTAAVSALATKILSRRDSSQLAILGSGTQASAHIQAMQLVRDITKIRVWSRTYTHARRLASARENLRIEVVDSAAQALRGADIICTTTSSPAPVLRREWLSEGCHINAIGAYSKGTRELDTKTVKECRLFVDNRESAMREAGDFLIPWNNGDIDKGHIAAELGELVAGKAKGRTSQNEITVFKSVGLAIEDLAAARAVYLDAESNSKGTWMEFGEEREK